jgi:hypothetical protein
MIYYSEARIGTRHAVCSILPPEFQQFQASLQHLPFFFAEAMADEDLIAYLRTNKLDIIRTKELPRLACADDKTKLEKAVEDSLAVIQRIRPGHWIVIV